MQSNMTVVAPAWVSLALGVGQSDVVMQDLTLTPSLEEAVNAARSGGAPRSIRL